MNEISPDQNGNQPLLDMPPVTEHEQLLMEALAKRNHHISYQKQVIGGLQHKPFFTQLMSRIWGDNSRELKRRKPRDKIEGGST